MIVLTEAGSGLYLVRQADHAVLSSRMAERWQRPAALPADIWGRLLQAVQCHDDGWAEAEAFPALDHTGRPYDFLNLPTPQHIAVWRRGIDLAQRTDRYAALLIAQHARRLYTHHASETDPADIRQAQCFINDATNRIDKLLHGLGKESAAAQTALLPRNLMTAVNLLSVFDTLSLLLLGALPWRDKLDRLEFAEQRACLKLHRGGTNGHIAVTPWPFVEKKLELQITGRRLDQRQFTDPAQLAQLLAEAAPVDRHWTLTPA